ncbi:MAG: 2-oxo acid dehydrogenase subunit E2, partial [Myxococcales bacterium]|nr:2-oxo acid dehydrogenase subunit E2 [Myxococcales bacterium]
LGSVGLEAPFHHLYEWGTAPLFCSIGKVVDEVTVSDDGEMCVRPMLTLRWSFDERVADGFYCARTLDLIREFIAHPERLDLRPGDAALPSEGEQQRPSRPPPHLSRPSLDELEPPPPSRLH